MAQSTVDVCNSALQRLGAASLTSLGDNSREARQCNIAFDSNRRAELRKNIWNFSIKRVQLAPDAAAPDFDYTYQFTLPSDCIRVLLTNDTDLDWKLEGRKILTNRSDVLNLRYVADITDVSQWDPAFYDVVSVSLAIDMCEALTNSTNKRVALGNDYKEAIAAARQVNALEQLPVEPPMDSFLVARFGSAGTSAPWFKF